MSRLSGSITNTTSSANRSGRYESSGSVIAKRCLHCGEIKPASHISHPLCSIEIQKKVNEDENSRLAWLIMDRINGYGVTV
jgi:hypothetical protein